MEKLRCQLAVKRTMLYTKVKQFYGNLLMLRLKKENGYIRSKDVTAFMIEVAAIALKQGHISSNDATKELPSNIHNTFTALKDIAIFCSESLHVDHARLMRRVIQN